MSVIDIHTFEDVVEHVLDMYDLDPTPRNRRQARRALVRAYRDLPQMRSWSCFVRQAVINTVASYTTGTVTYDHTGGTYERQVTLSGGTFPTWAEIGRILVNNVVYTIDERKSDTVVTLNEGSNPGSDITDASSYEIFRESYPLPNNFRKLIQVMDTSDQKVIPIVDDLFQHVAANSTYRAPGTPWIAALRNDGEAYGTLSLVLSPPPSTARSYDVLYESKPRDFTVGSETYNTGTVTTSAGSTTITGTGTSWVEGIHSGAIIRISSSSQRLPTSLIGSRQDNLLNPYVAQRKVVKVNSSTSITVDASVDTTYTGVMYTISDPIDLESTSMMTAFFRLAELELARLLTRNDVPVREQTWALSVRAAMENDQRATRAFQTTYEPFVRANVTTSN